MAILAFGVVLIVCVLLLLRRESEPTASWLAAPEGASGRHLQRLSRLLRAIRSINALVLVERDGQRLLEKACGSLIATRSYRMAWIGLVEEGTRRVRPVTQAGFEEGYVEHIEVTWDDSPTGRGPTGQAIRSGEPTVMRDIEAAPEYRPWREQALRRGYRSSAAVPLRFGGQVLGALNVYAEVPDAFDIEEIGLLQEVADHLACALGSIELQEELAEANRKAREAERVRPAFEDFPLGVVVTDSNGTVTGINRRMMEFLDGYQSPDEVIETVRLPDLAPFSEPSAQSGIQKVFSEGQRVSFQCRATAADGRRRALSCEGVPVFGEGEGLTETVWFVQDVSERPASDPPPTSAD